MKATSVYAMMKVASRCVRHDNGSEHMYCDEASEHLYVIIKAASIYA